MPLSSPARRRWRRVWAHARGIVLPLAVVVILGVLWEAGVRYYDVKEFILPAPSKIFEETWATRESVLGHTIATLRTTLFGFFISVAISLPLAVAITSSPLVANAIYPLLVLTQSIPKVALAPILVVIVGVGEPSRVIVAFLVAFFPLVISVATGLLVVPPELIELGRSLKASKLQMLLRIRLPYSIPFLFSGLKLSITFSVIGAVVGEFIAADKGLGYQILTATAFFRSPLAYGAVVILSVLGISLFQAVVFVERIFFPWSAQEDRAV